MHQQLAAGDHAEGVEGIDREVLQSRQATAGHSQRRNRAIRRAVAGTQIVDMRPIGHVVQKVRAIGESLGVVIRPMLF